MPTDPHRRHDIAVAVTTYDAAHPTAPLPRNTVRVLAVMFPSGNVCQQSLEAIAGEGFHRRRLLATLLRLIEAGFLSRYRVAGMSDTYRLHVPPVQL